MSTESASLFDTLLERHGVKPRRLPPPDRPPLDEIEANAHRRAEEFIRHYPPETEAEIWLIRRVGLACARLDEIQRLRAEARADRIRRAVSHWEQERQALAERIAAKLNASPSEVVARLKCTRQGVEWLIRCWEGLRAVLLRCGAWDKAQWKLAINLLGTRPEVREEIRLQIEERALEDRLKTIDEELDWLRRYLESRMIPLDKGWRIYSENGYFFHPDENERALIRQETEQRRALNAAFRELRHANKALAQQLFGRRQSSPTPESNPAPIADSSSPMAEAVAVSATPPAAGSKPPADLERPASQTNRTVNTTPAAGSGSGSDSGTRRPNQPPARTRVVEIASGSNGTRPTGSRRRPSPPPNASDLPPDVRQRLDAARARWDKKKRPLEAAPGNDRAERNPTRPPPASHPPGALRVLSW